MSIEKDPEYIALPETHKKFINNLYQGQSATEAYKGAFPNASRATAATRGGNLKKKYEPLFQKHALVPSIALERIASKTLENLQAMAFADPKDMMRGKSLKPISEMPEALRMAISEVQVDGDKMSFKLGGRIKALEILARMCNMGNEGQEVAVKIMTDEEKIGKLRELVVAVRKREGLDEE